MASISKDSGGLRRIQFVGADKKRKAIRLGKVSQESAIGVKLHLEKLIEATFTQQAINNRTAAWVADLDPTLYDRIAAVGLLPKRADEEETTLVAYLDSYIAKRTDVKASTAIVYGHTRRCLLEFFGPKKSLAEISEGEADEWRLSLIEQGLAENTVRRRCGIAKQFFRAAVRKRLLSANPFSDLTSAVKANSSRFYFLAEADSRKVLEACPDAQWRLIFALSRYGGLRCPSEHLGLKWDDVDWASNRIRVSSPKTEHHEGKAFRWIPLFLELRPHLEAVYDQAPPKTEFVITMRRDATTNLRTRFEKIIKRAGLKPWPKLFQNLRSTRETELAESFPMHVVCEWMGNSQPVAAKHYLQVTDAHFARGAESGARETPNQAQQGGEVGRKEVNAQERELKPIAASLGAFSTSHDDSGPCTLATGIVRENKVGDEGLEPPTLSV